MKIGWIGLGNMGVPMASNIIKAGHEVSVFNRTKEKATPVLALGASLCESIGEIWNTSDIVFTMLSDDEAVKNVYPDLMNPKANGKLVIDMSTVSPKTSKELADICTRHGISFLDAPVSGSVQPAREAKLVIMVGGEKNSFDRAKPLFDTLGKSVLHLGENGAGTSAKLAINLLLGIFTQGIAESVMFAEDHGISRDDMLTIINQSAMSCPYSQMKTSSILNNEFPAAFALKHMAKDLRLAAEQGANTPLAEAVAKTYQGALAPLGNEDVMSIIKLLR